MKRATVAALAVLLAGCGSKASNTRTADGAADGADAAAGQGAGGASGSAGSPADGPVDRGAAGDGAGDTESDAGAADPFTRAIESFCKQKALRLCAKTVACNYFAVSEPYCRETTEADCHREMDVGPARSAAAGRLEVDEAALARCLAAYDRIQCPDAFTNPPVPCRRLFKGKIADGQPCLNRDECAGGICRRTDKCLGTCASYGAIGAACGDAGSTGCDPATSFCDLTTRKCTAAIAHNGSCRVGGNPLCVEGDHCVGTGGGSCSGIDPNCICVALPTIAAPSKKGEPCDLNANVYCEPGLACIPTMTDAGAELTGTCGPRVAEGSKCTTECQVGLKCVPDDPNVGPPPGTCRPLVKAGEDCLFPPDCAEGLTCYAGKCQALAACTVNHQIPCLGGLPVGAMCSSSADCASWICLQRVCVAACSTADLP